MRSHSPWHRFLCPGITCELNCPEKSRKHFSVWNNLRLFKKGDRLRNVRIPRFHTSRNTLYLAHDPRSGTGKNEKYGMSVRQPVWPNIHQDPLSQIAIHKYSQPGLRSAMGISPRWRKGFPLLRKKLLEFDLRGPRVGRVESTLEGRLITKKFNAGSIGFKPVDINPHP